MRSLLVACLVLASVFTSVLAAPGADARTGTVTSTSPPVVKGDAVYGHLLTAGPGQWDPAAVTVTYHWLRDDQPVAGATDRTYRLGLDDVDHPIAVMVTATDADGDTGTAVSAETARVDEADLTNRRPPKVKGVQRFFHTVTATEGRWSATPSRVRYHWLRDGERIAGAHGRHYTYVPDDVGHRVRVQVTALVPGYHRERALSAPAGPVRNRVDVRRTVTYSVQTRGHITADLQQFRSLAQQTYDDPRGWLAKGVRFRPVATGGSFTLVLAEASQVPSFSSECSSTYSCRVGRFVIINQTRWLHASPAWHDNHGSLRDYRDLVVNHETGHWLGYHHTGCPGPGRLAPVMMQQSKGLDGCRINPWPTVAELDR